MIRRSAAVLFLAALSACGGGNDASGTVPRERFIAANVALRSLPDSTTPRGRAHVLKKHGVTERQLRAWVRVHSRDPEVLAKAWEEIAFKLDSAGGTPPAGAPSPPGGQVPPSAGAGAHAPPSAAIQHGPPPGQVVDVRPPQPVPAGPADTLRHRKPPAGDPPPVRAPRPFQ